MSGHTGCPEAERRRAAKTGWRFRRLQYVLDADFREVANFESGPGMGKGTANRKHRHSCGQRGLDSGMSILDDKTMPGGNSNALSREDKDLGIRF